MANKRANFLCPKCGQLGFLAKKWVRSSYYPKKASVSCKRFEEMWKKLEQNPKDVYLKKQVEFWRTIVRGNRYRGWEAKELFDREACYRVFTRKYFKYYVGHYDKEKYEKQMKQFKKGNRKSKPSGRKWCGPINSISSSLF